MSDEYYEYDEYLKSQNNTTAYTQGDQSNVQGDAPAAGGAAYSSAPVYGTQQMPVTEDAYIRRIDEMAREREEEKKPKKRSFAARAFG